MLAAIHIELMLRVCKRLFNSHRFLLINNCILIMTTTWLYVQAHGDKKGGASQDGVKTDKGQTLKVSWDARADSYTATKLEVFFQRFGRVEDIVIKTRKSRSRGSAIVFMGTREAAVSPFSLHSTFGFEE